MEFFAKNRTAFAPPSSTMTKLLTPSQLCKRSLIILFLAPFSSGFIVPQITLRSRIDVSKYHPLFETSSSSQKQQQSGNDDDNSNNRDDYKGALLQNERTSGILVLASVPLAWGTYSPVVKYLYEVEPKIPGIVFSAAYYMVASILLSGLSRNNNDKNPAGKEKDVEFPLMGGIELGSYLFIANALQVKGLETVPSDRAGFLVQLTTIMVPLMQAAFNGIAVPLQTWIACLLAFSGVIVMGLDGSTVDPSLVAEGMSSISVSQGDFLIMAAAVLYSLHVVRLGRYATQTTALKLATSKAVTETALSVCVVSSLLFLGYKDGDVSTFFAALSAGLAAGTVTLATMTPAIAAVLWTGFVTCAYTIFAQAYGQARVGPTEANLLYTIQPLFTAIFGYLLLGETLGRAGIAGALLIASAVYSVSIQDGKPSSNEHDDGSNDASTSILPSVETMADAFTTTKR